eukprot:Ihof_evm3s166 gene=Ihof_evmTU3s166
MAMIVARQRALLSMEVMRPITILASRGLCTMEKTARQYVGVKEEGSGVYSININRPPVNSLNTQLLTELVSALDEIEGNHDARGVVLGSQLSTIFSAGLDILEMYKPNVDKLRAFWGAVQTQWIRFYGSRLPIIAAINGAAPGGGCMLALSCDYRIMTKGRAVIGLNETQLGIVAPDFFIDTMKATVGHRQAERMLQLGLLLDPHQALANQTVDEIVDHSLIWSSAVEVAKKWA